MHLVPRIGLEPTWSCPRGILSPLRLPFRHSGASETLAQTAASLNAKAQKKALRPTNGPPCEARTHDPLIKSQVLYH